MGGKASKASSKKKTKDDKLEKELETLKEKVTDCEEQNLRLYAEFDNYKKRAAKERIELIQNAGQDLVKELLPVLDDFERGLKVFEEAKADKAIVEGLLLIFNKLKHTLQEKGLKEMEVNGQPFDSELHEAITEVTAPSKDMKDKVVDVIEKGYYLNDKIIRYAKVVVGK